MYCESKKYVLCVKITQALLKLINSSKKIKSDQINAQLV